LQMQASLRRSSPGPSCHGPEEYSRCPRTSRNRRTETMHLLQTYSPFPDDTRMATPRGSISELLQGPATIPVPRAGAYLGLGRSASYQAAKTGVIPTIKVGARKRLVPTAEFARLLGANPA
jgi:hypothetical protein